MFTRRQKLLGILLGILLGVLLVAVSVLFRHAVFFQ
jgi:hypothetical protein